MADDDHLGRDFDLGFTADEEGRVFSGPYSRLDLVPRRRDDVSPRVTDLGLVSGRANLVQALILRLSTERGELEPLGHPRYGSRHHRLIGEPNSEGNRNLLKLFVLECLRQEPRLEKIVAVDVTPGEGGENRDKVQVRITVKARGEPDPLSLVLPFSFAGPLE